MNLWLHASVRPGKDQAANQPGNVREWLFKPTPSFQNFADCAQVFGAVKRQILNIF
jgi:hypothetical protein